MDTDTITIEQHESNLRTLAGLAAVWSTDLRVRLSPTGVWWVETLTRAGRVHAFGCSARDFAHAVAECLEHAQRLTDDEDRRAAEVAS